MLVNVRIFEMLTFLVVSLETDCWTPLALGPPLLLILLMVIIGHVAAASSPLACPSRGARPPSHPSRCARPSNVLTLTLK